MNIDRQYCKLTQMFSSSRSAFLFYNVYFKKLKSVNKKIIKKERYCDSPELRVNTKFRHFLQMKSVVTTMKITAGGLSSLSILSCVLLEDVSKFRLI